MGKKRVGCKKNRVNPKWFRHEALDRTHVVLDSLNSYLIEHMYHHSGINPTYSQHIENAANELAKAYQACNKENEIKADIEVE